MRYRLIHLASTTALFLSVCTAGAQTTDWKTQADSHRGRNGQTFEIVCPGGGSISTRLWGTDVYTDDSSICTAAVHAGLITTASGGAVTIEIRPGQSSYAGGTRHGVTSLSYGTWKGSFVFVAQRPPLENPDTGDTRNADWRTQADGLRGRNGAAFSFACPSGGSISSRLWGTDVYTDDSSICTAAVHAGLITTAAGGAVTIEIRPGQSSYAGSARHGATSLSYGTWKGSFVFVAQKPPLEGPDTGDTRNADWRTQADGLRGRNGEIFSFACPSGGSISSRLWGTDVYTDDSSICTAAVHAGLITTASGGAVTIEIRAGQSSYAGSARHGVTSKGYGTWKGSFVFVGGTQLGSHDMAGPGKK